MHSYLLKLSLYYVQYLIVIGYHKNKSRSFISILILFDYVLVRYDENICNDNVHFVVD